jgi:WD40 repeat protein
VLYAHHTQEIGAIVLSPDGRFVASGERGPSPGTHIWDPATGRQLAMLPLAHGGDVKLLAFSADGRMLASVGLNGPRGSGAGDHSLAVFGSASGGWEDARLLATADLDHRVPLCLAFLATSDTQVRPRRRQRAEGRGKG